MRHLQKSRATSNAAWRHRDVHEHPGARIHLQLVKYLALACQLLKLGSQIVDDLTHRRQEAAARGEDGMDDAALR